MSEKKPEKAKLAVGAFIVSGTQMALDQKMVKYDLRASLAHTLMLNKVGAIKNENIKKIVGVLKEIEDEVDNGTFIINPEKGAQLSLEARIVAGIGDVGFSVHTGRSRNDQVMVTEMLYLREEVLKLSDLMLQVFTSLLECAKKNESVIIPGYTHMQPAKATTFGQWSLAHLNALMRAMKNLENNYDTYNMNPLGACESYGTSWPLDREYTAKLLGFPSVWEIPQDVISSRGFPQLAYLTGMRDICVVASKMAQDLILFDTFEYGVISLGNEVAQRMHPITGSSVMAQKKNPDVLEIIRSTAPQVTGYTEIVSNVLTALQMGYNRDSRESKEYIDLGLSKTFAMLTTLEKVITTLQIDSARALALVKANYSQTTDLADYISQKSGVGYRLIYKAVGGAVDEAINNGKLLTEITPGDLQKKFDEVGVGSIPLTIEEIELAIDPAKSIEKRTHIGGSSRETMQKSFANAEHLIKSHTDWVKNQKYMIESANALLAETAKKVADL